MISDEKLSAFLDAELPENEMEVIRGQLEQDENLANRLAELTMVDGLVAKSFSQIDSRPLPRSITNLLAQDEKTSNNIVAFPLLKKIRYNIQQHAAVAASVALVIGFGVTQMLNKDPETGTNLHDWKSIAQVLETTPSGINRGLTSGVQVKPQLTFVNKQDEFCRQFQIRDHKGTSENIACREGDKWQLSMSIKTDKSADANTYQTASGGSALDSAVDEMTSGNLFDAEAESAAIAKHWSTEK